MYSLPYLYSAFVHGYYNLAWFWRDFSQCDTVHASKKILVCNGNIESAVIRAPDERQKCLRSLPVATPPYSHISIDYGTAVLACILPWRIFG